ncbi:hypothetical protein [Burkholderia pyrrocinia]|uniref:hypothetical protein n=1 Tax=Burkholderia pyrrocinia TaxID=60550 RepID=UPI001588E8D0|nr:hypothetical protein [Burkholderia pyrrocinia]
MKFDHQLAATFWETRNEQFRKAVMQPAIVRRAMQQISRSEARAQLHYGLPIGFEQAVVEAYLEHLGSAFQGGRKKDATGPVRKAIRRELARDPSASTKTLWNRIALNPPKGWAFFNNRAGVYAEGPRGGQNMNARTFANVASMERKRLKSNVLAPS